MSDEIAQLPILTVYYNTLCPVCNAGINRQRSKLVSLARSGVIAFRDINLEPDALSRYGVTVDDIRRRLHALNAAGELVAGADVAIAIWRLTPGESWLSTLLGSRLILPLTRLVYDWFADILFAWNKRHGRW